MLVAEYRRHRPRWRVEGLARGWDIWQVLTWQSLRLSEMDALISTREGALEEHQVSVNGRLGVMAQGEAA